MHSDNADGSELQEIRRQRVRLRGVLQPEFRRIHIQLLGDLIDLNFLAESRLHGAVSALGSAGRLIRERAATLKLVPRNVIGRRLKRAGIESARHSVRTVRAAVDQSLQMHPGESCRLCSRRS